MVRHARRLLSSVVYCGWLALALGCSSAPGTGPDVETVPGLAIPSPSEAPESPIAQPAPPDWSEWVETRVGVRAGDDLAPDVGSQAWMHEVSLRLGVIDAEGHGPTPGSDEWRQAVEFHLGDPPPF